MTSISMNRQHHEGFPGLHRDIRNLLGPFKRNVQEPLSVLYLIGIV